MSKPYTEDEIREQFLRHVHDMIHYWNDLPDKSTQEKMEGLAFSIMSTIDGCSCSLPGFKLVADPHEDDKQYHIDNGEDYYPEDIDIGGCLHELFDRYRRNR